MDGILVIDKQVGPTSHDVVAKVRRQLREKKVGHTGTLDPMATGVLPLVLGRATKLAQFLTGGDKTYQATFGLGVETRTLDAAGEIVAEHAVNVTEEQMRRVLGEFLGEIEQVPPMFSAKKLQGQRLYELARQGIEVEREPKKVTIHAIRLLDFAPPDVQVEVRCSAGTYVRVLAKDVGERIGSGAHLKQLRRTTAGPFTIDDAVSLDLVESDPEQARAHILSLGRALADLPRIDLPERVGQRIAAGQQLKVSDLRTLDVPAFDENQLLALFLDSGELFAVARSLISSAGLNSSRREQQAIKTERVVWARR